MTTMHEACTARAVEVMQWFLGDHRMLRDDTAALADMPPPPPRAPPDGADGAADASPMLALDKLLDELALVCQIAHRYCRFASDVLAVNMHHQPTTSRRRASSRCSHKSRAPTFASRTCTAWTTCATRSRSPNRSRRSTAAASS